MGNSLSVVIPRLLAQGLLALRGACVMPRLVNADYSALAAQKGSTIDVPIPSAIQAQAVSPGPTPPTTADIGPTMAQIKMDQWFEAPFYLTDNDFLQIMNGTIPMQASEAVKALANNVNGYLLGLGRKFYGFVGTPGTTPFAANSDAATDVRKVLNKQLAPGGDRRLILDVDAEAKALALPAFQYVNQSGNDKVMVEGVLGKRFGFDVFSDQQVPSHTSGAITTGLAAKAATPQAAGLTSIVCTTAAATGACALKEGDIVLFAGDSQTYVLTTDVAQAAAATDIALPIYPPKQVALAGGEAVTVKASHVMNLAFHRDAIAFATRPLIDSAEGLGNLLQSAVDPQSGLTLRLEVSREHKRTRFSYDVLYGADVVRRELGARVAG
jgi:hypothetical protein